MLADPDGRGHREAGARPGLTLLGEQLRADTEWVVTGRTRLRKRVVTETRVVEVTLRREELVIEELPVDGDEAVNGTAGARAVPAPGPVAPWSTVLRREVPHVEAVIEPYERVTVSVDLAEGTAPVTGVLRREQVRVDADSTTA